MIPPKVLTVAFLDFCMTINLTSAAAKLFKSVKDGGASPSELDSALAAILICDVDWASFASWESKGSPHHETLSDMLTAKEQEQNAWNKKDEKCRSKKCLFVLFIIVFAHTNLTLHQLVSYFKFFIQFTVHFQHKLHHFQGLMKTKVFTRI